MRAVARGVLIVRDENGIARFDDWDGLPDATQRRFRQHLTEYERAIYPLRRPPEIIMVRGHNGFPFLPDWDGLDLDTQEVLYEQMDDEERREFPLKKAAEWQHPTKPWLPRKRTKDDAGT